MWPSKGPGPKWGTNGVQRGASPLKNLLTGTPKQSVLVPNAFWMKVEWQRDLWHMMTGDGFWWCHPQLVQKTAALRGAWGNGWLRSRWRSRLAVVKEKGVAQGAENVIQTPQALCHNPLARFRQLSLGTRVWTLFLGTCDWHISLT